MIVITAGEQEKVNASTDMMLTDVVISHYNLFFSFAAQPQFQIHSRSTLSSMFLLSVYCVCPPPTSIAALQAY